MTVDPGSELPYEDITRLVQEGRRPEDLGSRARLAVDKLTGRVPLGIDVPNKTARKVIGGAGKLLVVLRYGFLGVMCVGLGTLFIWAGSSGHFDFKTVAIGVGLLALGVFALWRASRAWRVLRAISRA